MDFNNLNILTLSNQLKKERFSLDLSYDLILIPREIVISSSINLYYTEKSIERLLKVIPELNVYDFQQFIVCPGEKVANLYLKRINSPFTFKTITNTDKISPEDYANCIQSWQLPLVNIIDQYLHDFYMHGLGAYLIPSNFISWWGENKNSLSNKEKIILASVVEWTTIKFTNNCIVEIFNCNSWQVLAHYLGCPKEDIEQVYSKYPTKEFIKQWNMIK